MCIYENERVTESKRDVEGSRGTEGMCVKECVKESRNGEELTRAKIHLLFPERRQGGTNKKSYAITRL